MSRELRPLPKPETPVLQGNTATMSRDLYDYLLSLDRKVRELEARIVVLEP